MRHVRSCLTFANIVLVIALFVALGGTAVASLLTTSNSQVAAGTISGHNPPAGDRPNIINGSVNGADLASGSVGSAELANGEVNHSKLSADSVTSANVKDNSLKLSDLVGADESGTFYFSVAANTCERVSFPVSGAAPGQAALLTWNYRRPRRHHGQPAESGVEWGRPRVHVQRDLEPRHRGRHRRARDHVRLTERLSPGSHGTSAFARKQKRRRGPETHSAESPVLQLALYSRIGPVRDLCREPD